MSTSADPPAATGTKPSRDPATTHEISLRWVRGEAALAESDSLGVRGLTAAALTGDPFTWHGKGQQAFRAVWDGSTFRAVGAARRTQGVRAIPRILNWREDMGFRARRSFKIAPGIRMTVTPRGVGLSAGRTGMRISANTSGRVRRTIGVPGTGMSYVTTSSMVRGSSSQKPRVATSAQVPRKQASPGMLAPKWEKLLYKAIQAGDTGQYVTIGTSDPKARDVCMMLDVLATMEVGDFGRAVGIGDALWAEGYDPAADRFLIRYAPNAVVDLEVAEGVRMTLTLDRDTLGLVVAELRQNLGAIEGAIQVVEQVTPSTVAAVSLAELYAAAGRWADVVDLTNGVTNDDEPATYLLIQRGAAFREQCRYEAARESLRLALAPRSRPSELRHLALIERGKTYQAEGKNTLARKDFEKVLAQDSNYPGLAEHLANCAS